MKRVGREGDLFGQAQGPKLTPGFGQRALCSGSHSVHLESQGSSALLPGSKAVGARDEPSGLPESCRTSVVLFGCLPFLLFLVLVLIFCFDLSGLAGPPD